MPDQEIIIEGDAGFVPKAEPADAGKVLGVLNASGDIGWVIDQSGTFTQQQADWAETDPSKVTYIDHKPDLSVYATASSVETALAGKQDIIGDLSTIRSGAEKGDTAVQPGDLAVVAETGSYTDLSNKPDLSVYATTSAMETALAGKQATIPDLDTIRAGAAAGATAAQPGDLPSSDELVPSATSVDAGKVLTVGNDGTASWVTPSAGTVYTPGDGIDITSDVISADVDGVTIGIDSTTKKIKSLQVIPTKTSDLQNDSNFVVASSLATVATSGSYADLSNKPVIPTKTSDLQNDSNFVSSSSLATVATTGNYSDLSGKPTIPSVDQTYSASSSNAQSGTAVAQAIASIPSSSYTAGDGIAIESGEISVDYDSDTLDTVAGSITESVSQVDTYEGFTLPTSIQQMQTQNDPVNVSVHIPANTFRYNGNKDDMIFTFALCRGTSALGVNSYVDAPLAYTEASSNVYWIDEQTIVFTLPTLQTNGWEYDTNLSVKESFNVVGLEGHSHTFLTTISDGGTLSSPITFTYSGGTHEILTVKNPLPASAQADSGKVLKVNASGNAEWGTDSDTTYTAGNMIAINAGSNNAIGVSTTAGVTDIQVVNALPASPVATVLYLIPQT